MIRVAVVAAIWLVAGAPVLLRAIRDRARARREDVGDVLARVVAAADGRLSRQAGRPPTDPPIWPLFLLSFVATTGAAAGSTPVAGAAVVVLNLLTVAHGHRARSRAIRVALAGSR